MNDTMLLFLRAVALVFVIEGMLPFLSPDAWRKMMAVMTTYDNKTLRVVGLVCMLIGTLILFVLHY